VSADVQEREALEAVPATAAVAREAPPAASARSWRIRTEWKVRRDWFPIDSRIGQILRGLRWGAILVWIGIVVATGYYDGIPFDRTSLLLWLAPGLLAFSIGRHPMSLVWVVVDFAPLGAVLVVYDYLRGWSTQLGLPTWWTPQIDVDKVLFLGREPTLWLQEHLKHPTVQWYDVVVALCYYSFFFLPYLTAAVMWLRSRADFYRWSLRFVALSFFAFALFALIPAAPPWYAARCAPSDVASHPAYPICPAHQPNGGGLLGTWHGGQPGANPWIEQIVSRGFGKLHLGVAQTLLSEGRVTGDAVAAVPSLHLGGTVLFVIFMWSRLSKWWRPLLVAYPLLMSFSLVYAGEHYLADCIAGALAAALIHWIGTRIERRWRKRRTPLDTLDGPSAPDQATPSEPALESTCPPIETTASSI
jgi:hypothetical protein